MTSPTSPLPEPWTLPQAPDHIQVQRLATELDIPVLVAEILCLRGYATAEDARKFLEPRLGTLGDPFAMDGMEATVDRLLLAIDRREQVLLFGDYDVDGVTSSGLLYQVLKAMGADVHCHIPHRETGRGIGLRAGRMVHGRWRVKRSDGPEPNEDGVCVCVWKGKLWRGLKELGGHGR